MALTVKQVIEAQSAVEALIQSDRENKFVFSSATRIKLAGNLRKTRPVVDDYRKEHAELVKRLGEPIEGKDGVIKVKKENNDEFAKENEGMLSADTEVVLNPVDAYQLSGVSKEDFLSQDSDSSKQNQIPVDVYSVLLEVGLIKE